MRHHTFFEEIESSTKTLVKAGTANQREGQPLHGGGGNLGFRV